MMPAMRWDGKLIIDHAKKLAADTLVISGSAAIILKTEEEKLWVTIQQSSAESMDGGGHLQICYTSRNFTHVQQLILKEISPTNDPQGDHPYLICTYGTSEGLPSFAWAWASPCCLSHSRLWDRYFGKPTGLGDRRDTMTNFSRKNAETSDGQNQKMTFFGAFS